MPLTMVDALLTRLQREPGRPRLTWYGSGGERVELSGSVLDNWVAKTANLLVEELDAGPGTRVRLDLPPHWRTVVWALATWRVGACVVLDDAVPGAASTPDVVVTDRPHRHVHEGAHRGPVLVAVALPALARRSAVVLPSGAIDAASAVMTYGDVIGWAPAVDLAAPALTQADAVISHGDLAAWAAPAAVGDPGGRVLVTTGPDDTGAEAARVLRTALATLDANGSVVVLDPGTTAELTADHARLARLVDSERITARAPAPDQG